MVVTRKKRGRQVVKDDIIKDNKFYYKSLGLSSSGRVKDVVIIAPPITRVLASLIDFFIINMIIIGPFRKNLSVISHMNSMNSVSRVSSELILEPRVYASAIAIFLLIIAYFTLFEFLTQSTPGKLLFNLFVVRVRDKANSKGVGRNKKEIFEKPMFWQCLIKNMILFPILPFVVFWFFDLYFLFKTKKRLIEKFLGLETVLKARVVV